jgi:hypothetical protein
MFASDEECLHRHTTSITTGGYHFAAGEFWDDIREMIVCLDCGATLQSNDIIPDMPEDAHLESEYEDRFYLEE